MSTLSHTLRVSSPALPVFAGEPLLHPVRLCGHEGVNTLFCYELLLQTPDSLTPGALAEACANLDLDALIGREICCEIELDGSGYFLPGGVGDAVDGIGIGIGIGAGIRQINALITEAALVGEEGRHLQYRLVLRPWLHLATLNADCRIFQNATVVDILDAVLAHYPFPVDKRLLERYPIRDYQTQFNESDFAFFERLCQEWGISYHFEHDASAHRLVLSDHLGAYLPNPSQAYRTVEYHPPGWKLDAEYLHAFVPDSRLTPGRYSSRDYDYTRPRADLRASRTDARPTGFADAEVYAWHAGLGGSHYAQPNAGTASPNDPRAEGDLIARLRMQALRTAGARARASGNLRAMVPGFTFTLQNHPRDAANADYLILETDLLVEDTGPDSQVRDAAPDRQQHWRVKVDLTAHPITEPLRPMLTRPKPHTHGPQTALVVGPEGQNLWTDELGRIKVQFPWDRQGRENQHSSCWVRVSSPWAGNQLGGVHIPRIGQEVVVDFIAGDPDLPICTGRVHNQMNLPPWALPGQSALSGFRSRELNEGGGNSAAGRSNHLVMDDTAGRIQAQLKSDHQHSSLSLGSITRIEDNEGRKEARGEGFELRTDGHGVLRAQDGMLISTEGRANAAGGMLDMDETVQRLRAAQDQHDTLAGAAQAHGAQDAGDDQDTVQQALKAQNDEIAGSAQDSPPLGELKAPHMVLASPAGIAATAAESLRLHSGGHTAVTSGQHISVSAAGRWLASAAQGLRSFVRKGGLKWIASRGPVQVQAHQGEVVLVAHKDVRITSVEGRIRIQAKKKVVLIGGGSYTEWSAEGIRHGTAGSWQEHAAMHAQVGPMSRPVETRAFEAANLYQAHYVLRSQRDHAVLVHHPYKLTLPSGETWVGRTDDRGQTATAFTRNPDEVHLQALDTRPPQQEPWHLSGGDSPTIYADYRDDESTLPPI